MYSVSVSKLVENFELEPLTPDIVYDKRLVTDDDVNRPALQLAGFFDYFDPTRLQIIGKVEHTYLAKMDSEHRKECIERLFSYKEIPCIILCRKDVYAFPEMLECAKKQEIPLFKTCLPTTTFVAEVNRWLQMELAPRISLHGVLVDIYGEGVLIKGESGIGKSETALELVRRGHRLVADDAVEIKRVSEHTLIGTSPEVIRHFIEVRGIGIVDIKQIFGVGAVKETKPIDLVIELELWNKKKSYDRLGLTNEYTDILGVNIVTNRIPIRPGRNIAIICETAAINFRQKKMGYNAAEALNERLMKNLQNP
ncbi:HPr(Ser) kinase/phosphatase [Candidatus Epulonipiscium fishelsonii]|uniref:HPr(Ser) kinase/phosphatase n=1 Tax=Candidatus Epulonipiscium fishelsonii TaxID=77094 RepID=A0ACC8X829_9FIRM|nr:HPr(Ser) kinase/phosphatase [Epulopiscium sp. SCG-B11WGA-EpuloA1]ONI41132.1 HPr(Ser) kinase/phosphatase [Epulopiscium sp. SCG-B05WGA-EpuloA1]